MDKNNFYFEEFVADYYVTRDTEGVSHMHVVEDLSAVFPSYDQNLGIIRNIPYTNQNGANITVPSKSALSLRVTRNGLSEPIYSIDKEDGYYMVSTGDDTTYLHGQQTFRFEYDFEKVVTDFGNFQELYWDTNGNGWLQRFDSLTARVHFTDAAADTYTGIVDCYVGSYGEKGSDRCEITELDDGFEFHATDLSRGENLTFAVQIQPNAFVVPVTYNPAILVFALINLLIFGWGLANLIRYLRATAHKKRYYQELFVAPQYQPLPGLTVAEASKVAIKPLRGDVRVASLLDLAVKGKISLVKGEKSFFGRTKWSIEVKDLTDIPKEQEIVLRILKGGAEPVAGETFAVENNRPTTQLQTLSSRFMSHLKTSLTDKGYFEESHLTGGRQNGSTEAKLARKYSGRVTMIGFLWFMALFLSPGFLAGFLESGGVLLGGIGLLVITFGLSFAASIVFLSSTSSRAKYETRTEQGLSAARYLEGLKLYMTMAEQDRIKFLQSVDGADTSPAGVVKLYEKLLPYAIIFGLEDSWLAELSRYYQDEQVTVPTWYVGAQVFRASDFRAFTTSTAAAISRSTMTSSSGASSSGSSGGGGGGYSGGGGGGGGGGGR